MQIREYQPKDLKAMCEIWNEVVLAGDAFPQEDPLDEGGAAIFFAEQSYTGVAEDDAGKLIGLYILHPNNVGRCGHIANASFAVLSASRGQGAGEAMVRDCLAQATRLSFRILQFNAVVAKNKTAVKLYRKLGFTEIGKIKGGFLDKDGKYQDILLFYKTLE